LVLQEKNEALVSGLLNIAKYRKISDAIQRFTKYATEPFNFQRNEKVSFYIEDRVGHSPKEEDLEKMSRNLPDN